MKQKILVIDDEESIRYTFSSFLTDEGYEVVTAENYEEAVARINDNNFDVIFADIILEDKSGIDILRKVRDRKLFCPVIMITGYPNIDTASEAVRMGAFDYIAKPVRQEALLHLARMASNQKRLQDENEKYRSNLEAIFRSVKDAIITVDDELNILEVNEKASAICAISRESIGKPFPSLSLHCDNRCLDALRKTVKSKQPVELYRVACKHDGNSGRVVTLLTSPLRNHGGDSYGAVLVVRDETRLNNLERDLGDRQKFYNMIGKNEKMQKVYSLIEDLADVQTTVLITGESGTGKELVAEAIHYKGSRRNRPLIKVNCAALSEHLLESELFGHVKGAFTSADRDKTGRFQKANGGTIFLDEIGDISSRMQIRLLRVLQEKVFERVGDATPLKVDVRVIAATHQDMEKKVRDGHFRQDLFYRLRVVQVDIPPLRERREDIPLLVDHFLEKFRRKFNKRIRSISTEAGRIFMDYPWPGNIRELEHTIEHAFIVCRQVEISVDHLPRNLLDHSSDRPSGAMDGRGLGPEKVLQALEKAGWNKSKAARLLGVNVRTIYRKIEQYGLHEERPS